MRKITLVLVLLLAFGFAAVADNGEDAAPAVKLTGELGLTIGADTQEDTPNLPVMSYAKKATAGITLSSEDEKVSASIELDLLAASSVSATTDLDLGFFGAVFGYGGPYAYDDYSGVDGTIGAWQAWEAVEDAVDFFNDVVEWVDDEATDKDLFTKATEQTAFLALLNVYTVNISASLASVDDGDIELDLSPVAPSDTPESDEFILDNAAATDVGTMAGAVWGYIDTMVDTAIDLLTDAASTAAVQAITDQATLAAYVIGLLAEDVDDLTAKDKEQITEAVDYLSDYEEEQLAAGGGLPTATTTLTVTSPSFIKKASFKIKEIGGVVDLAGNLTDTNLKVGNISLDRKGHFDETDSDDAIGSYPSVSASLSSGVVEGLTAGVTFYSDANDAADEVDVSDTWYTWMDETDAEDPTEPKLGLKFDAGYSTTISDMTIGADAAIGIYDMAGGDASEFGLSLKPSFSGFGATVGLQFDNGLGMTYIGVDGSYSFMGIVPSVAFDMVTFADDSDNVLAWVEDDEYTTGMAAIKDAGGMAIGGGVKVDVGQFIGMTASVDGGATYAMPDDADAILGWNAGLSVTPLEMLTVGASVSDNGVWYGTVGSYLGFGADATVSLSPFTIKGGLDYKYIAIDDEDPATAGQEFGWSGSVAYTHSIATITASAGSAWDVVDEVGYTKWSLMTKIKF
jgi:hypothetical protein